MSADVRAVMDAVVAATLQRDVEALRGHLAPDVVLHSPATAQPFIGAEEVAELLGTLLGEVDDLEYSREVPLERGFILFFRMRFGKHELQGCNLFDLDDEGRIERETVFARPLPGAALFLQEVGPALARRHGRWRAALARSLPLPALLRGLDRLGTRVARPHAVKRNDQ